MKSRSWPPAWRYRVTLLRRLPGGGGFAVALAALFLCQASLPALTALTTGRVLGTVTSHAASGAALVPPLAALGALLLFGQVSDLLSGAMRFAVIRRIDGAHRRALYTALNDAPDLVALEDPHLRNDLRLASARPGNWTERTPGQAAVAQLWLAFRALGGGFTAWIVATYSWWLVLVLVAAVLATRTWLRRGNLAVATVWAAGMTEARRADHWRDAIVDHGPAKEIRVFGLSHWVVDRWRAHTLRHVEPVWRKGAQISRREQAIFLLIALAVTTGLCCVGVAAAHGEMSLSALATQLTAVLGLLALGELDDEGVSVAGARPVLAADERLRNLALGVGRSNASRGVAPAPRSGVRSDRPPHIRFEGVSFRYPGTDHQILDGVHLELRPADVVAIVGVNGSGKTTLTKLLAALYRPDRGRITADGVDLLNLDPSWWRTRLAVVFQDFIRYELPASANLVLGAGGRPPDPRILRQVSAESGLDPLISALPSGWRTPLSSRRVGGVDLSGGQWQHVALARALYAVRCGAQVLVMDEPTAHLDVRTEAEVFGRLLDGVAGATVLLISHRLSTVRRAQRIVVLADGRIQETGDHDELMAMNGLYAQLFTRQADDRSDELHGEDPSRVDNT